MLAATVNASIVIISLPAIFRGIQLNPLTPGNVSYLLWMLMGYTPKPATSTGPALSGHRHGAHRLPGPLRCGGLRFGADQGGDGRVAA